MRPIGAPRAAAGPRIDGAVRTLRRRGARRDLGGDLGAGAEAGIDEALRLQPIERLGIERQPLRLVEHLAVPFEAEPEQVLEDAVDIFGPDAAGIDVLDPKQEGPVPLAREIVREQRRISVAEMQPSGGTWREAGDGMHKALDPESVVMVS